MGVRPGVSFGAADLQRLTSAPAAVRAPSFVYVVEGSAHVKIGISADPAARLASLQTGSPEKLRLAYVAAVKSDNAFAIEMEAHQMLDRYRQSGEWFSVPASAAVATINAASYKLNDPVVSVPVDRVGEIARLASRPQATSGGALMIIVKAVAIAIIALVAAFVTLVVSIALKH